MIDIFDLAVPACLWYGTVVVHSSYHCDGHLEPRFNGAEHTTAQRLLPLAALGVHGSYLQPPPLPTSVNLRGKPYLISIVSYLRPAVTVQR